MVPTREDIEDYIESLEEYLYSSLSAATPDLPNFSEAINRLWLDVTRYGPPSLPSVPGLGRFEVPPPPPPPPPPSTLFDQTSHWINAHRWVASAIGLGLLGSGVLVGYAAFRLRAKRHAHRRARAARTSERRQVVVVLGGDTPLALPLIQALESAGYIVIASVATPEAVKKLELSSHGYVRALVLDPAEPAAIPYFLRSLQSTLSLRFPLTTHGDPHASPSTHPYLHAVLSLLTLPPPSLSGTLEPAPFEHLPLQSKYLSYLTSTHLTPLTLLQSLLPLFRAAPRTGSSATKCIVLCVPATHARVGVPFAAAQAMSAAATVRGVDVLRREIRAASLSSDSMKNIRVVLVDVGSVGLPYDYSNDNIGAERLMKDWTSSEKSTYGPAVLSAVEQSREHGLLRKPTDTAVFVDALVGVVSGGRANGGGMYGLGLRLGLGRVVDWVRGHRFSVGAGARTYTVASYLPSAILDFLLNVPHVLVSIRNSLIPITSPLPLELPPPPLTTRLPKPPAMPRAAVVKSETPSSAPVSDHEHDLSERSSEAEADVESNAGDQEPGASIGGSWISLKGHSPSSLSSQEQVHTA